MENHDLCVNPSFTSQSLQAHFCWVSKNHPMLCHEVLRKFVHRAFNPLMKWGFLEMKNPQVIHELGWLGWWLGYCTQSDFGNRLDIYFGYIYIYYYIYVYGYVSIDNISYESPLTTNIPHDLGNLLKCPFGTSSKGWAGVGLSAYTAADVCRSRCSDTLRNGLEFFAGNVLVVLTASENMAKTG